MKQLIDKIKTLFNRYTNTTSFRMSFGIWLPALILLIWMIISNIRQTEMFKDNEPTEWESNGPGYHK
jgi:hypothetical protein